MKTSSLHLISCVGVENDLPTLPHFLGHYARLGITPAKTHIVLNAARADAPGLSIAEELLAQHAIIPHAHWIAPYTSDTMWDRRREVQRQVATARDWVISADVDELHEYPVPLTELILRCERLGVNCVQGPMIDRLAVDGRLAPVHAEPSLFKQFPVEADVACMIRRDSAGDFLTGTVKVMLCRGDVLPSRGGHNPLADGPRVRYLYGCPLGALKLLKRPSFRFAIPTRVHHFKWTESLLKATQRRLATPGVSEKGQEYGEQILAYFAVSLRRLTNEVSCRQGRGFDNVPWFWRVAALRAMSIGFRFRRRVAHQRKAIAAVMPRQHGMRGRAKR